MRSVNSSSLSPAWNCLAADRKQDNYPPCSPAAPGGPALSRIRAGGGGRGGAVRMCFGREARVQQVRGGRHSQSGKEEGARKPPLPLEASPAQLWAPVFPSGKCG